jgi:hypothetical protein
MFLPVTAGTAVVDKDGDDDHHHFDTDHASKPEQYGRDKEEEGYTLVRHRRR